MTNATQKVMSAKEAISEYVQDGDQLIIGNYTISTCMELVCEVVRQEKKHLTLFSQSGILDVELLVAAGSVERLITTYVMRSGGKAGGSAVERAIKEGRLKIEDYTNFNYHARLVAGQHGFSYGQVFEGVMATDMFKKRGFMGDDKYRVVKCPFTGKDVLTVPAANPDVCIIHVPRADRFGNAQYWGAMGSVASSALASKKIIVSCEEIVEHDVIKASPHFTIIPAFRTGAVVEVPWGAHPTEVLGHYNADKVGWGLFQAAAVSADDLQTWMDEWVYGCNDRKAYIDHYIELFGSQILNSLKAKAFYSAPANYGSAFTSVWDDNNVHRSTGLTLEEIEQTMEARGMFYG
jgi:glutaconate CoA-transferase, subunit A